jgi:transposase
MSKAAGEVGKSGRRKRRSWTLEEKRRIVDESLEDGASIAEIARLYELNANQLFTWRRQFGLEPATASDVTTLLPVTCHCFVIQQRLEPRRILR